MYSIRIKRVYDEASEDDGFRILVDRLWPRGMRQAAAVLKSGDRTEKLRSLQVPALIIHGDSDKMVNVSGGRATAEAIPNAKLVIYEGMGHGLPKQLWTEFADQIANHIHRAEAMIGS
ncbi:MAG: DUF488 family protein [Clostridiales bacterium]|nr:DUF488 family protein [Clostridiales bacterium]